MEAKPMRGKETMLQAANRMRPIVLLGAVLTQLPGQTGPLEKAAKDLLEAKCASCHGAARMSGLDFRTRDSLLQGGKRGPAVVPGNADASLLYKAVRREGELQMPAGKGPVLRTQLLP